MFTLKWAGGFSLTLSTINTMKSYIKPLLAGLFCCFLLQTAIGQNRQQLRANIENRRKEAAFTKATDLFAFQRQKNAERGAFSYSELNINRQTLRELAATRPEALQLRVPTGTADRQALELELVQVDLFNGNNAPFFTIGEGGQTVPVNYEGGVHYRGIVKNSKDSTNFVSISVFAEGVMGLIVDRNHEWNLGAEQSVNRAESESDNYVLYDAATVENPSPFSCGTDEGVRPEVEELYYMHGDESNRMTANCVGQYVEADFDIYQRFGSDVRATLNFLTGLFNQSLTLYDNDDIDIYLSSAAVWTAADNYSEVDSDAALNSFTGRIGNNFVGDIAQLIALDDVISGGKSGLAAEIGFICGDDDSRHCYSDLYLSFGNVPTYSWDLNVVTHEAGHLLGSRHTHACVWNGDNTAIDGCAGGTEGGCDLPGNPAGGGTIMSYCHNTGVGMNFSLGFGPQPSAVIRNYVNGSACLKSCRCEMHVTTSPAVMNPEQPVLMRKFEGQVSVTSTSQVRPGAILQMDGGSYVDLKPGFHAQLGSMVLAYIDGCGGPEPEEQWEDRSAKPSDPTAPRSNDNTLIINELNATPNPFDASLTIRFEVAADQSVTLRMLDMNGVQVHSWYQEETLATGSYQAEFTAANLPAGVYLIEMQTPVGREVRRVVKL
jgi:hypothetical protein